MFEVDSVWSEIVTSTSFRQNPSQSRIRKNSPNFDDNCRKSISHTSPTNLPAMNTWRSHSDPLNSRVILKRAKINHIPNPKDKQYSQRLFSPIFINTYTKFEYG